MLHIRATSAVFALIVATVSTGCDQRSPAATQQKPTKGIEDHVRDLELRVKALEDLLPSQSHMMADVGDHFTNLWFAGEAENWPLADFYLAESRSHLHWAVRRIPIRKDAQGRDVNLVNILQAFENGQLTPLKGTIDGKNKAGFEKLYEESLSVCYSCHTAASKPYLRPQIPKEPVSRIMNFDPKARWPL
jgi:hypothetical protein